MVIIAGDFGFPEGGAPAARVRNLAHGFRAAGEHVHVVAMSDACGSDRPHYFESWGEGLTLERPAGRFSRPPVENRGLWDRLNWMSKVYLGSWAMAQRFRAADIGGFGDILVLYGRSYARLWPMVRAAREKQMTILLDMVEGTERFTGLGRTLNPVRWDWMIGVKQLPRLVDGVTAISQGLAARSRELGVRNVRVVPGVESWNGAPARVSECSKGRFRLMHVGALLAKDAPNVLVEFVRRVRERGLPVEVVLAGRYEYSPMGRNWQSALRECDQDRNPVVTFLGALPAGEMARNLSAAHGFLLLRADSPAERISFPTRLVEYLRCARPVFASNVGDIPHYLKDGREAVLLPPGDGAAAADKVGLFLRKPDLLRQIGEAGWARGRQCFDRDLHAREILAWAREIKGTECHVE